MLINSLKPISESNWNSRTARHLLNRAGFGIPRERMDALAAMSPEQAVDSFVDFDSIPPRFAPPDFLTYHAEPIPMMERAEERANERALSRRLRGWWLQRMAETPRPLEEKLTLFWHGHFATSAQKVRSAYANYHLNDTFRKFAAGNFKQLTTAVAQAPAMLRYLDNRQNVKDSPNENWARELMELFTMGPGHYTESDVKESARAFTGWSTRGKDFIIRRAQHDTGPKTFLGRNGHFDGYDTIDIIFEQPATAEFIVGKLWAFFAHDNPDSKIVEELAIDLRAHNYELRPILRKLFLAEAFYSDRAVGTLIKSPVECVLQTAADLRIAQWPYSYMAHMTAQLGQNLFFPPSVKGWDGGRAWINANTLLHRFHLPQTLVAAGVMQQLEPKHSTTGMRQNEQLGPYVKQLLQNAPPRRARYYRTQFRGASRDDRRAVLLEALMEFAPADSWHVERAYEGLHCHSPEGCIDALAQRLLGRPLSQTQRAQLAEVLANGHAPPNDLNKLAALRLMMSLAEYQLA